MEGVTSIQCDWRSWSVQHVRRQACFLLWAGRGLRTVTSPGRRGGASAVGRDVTRPEGAGRRLRAVTAPGGRGEACGGRGLQGGVGGAADGAPVPSLPSLSSPPAAAAQSLCPDFRGARNGTRRSCWPPAHAGFYWDWVAHVAGLGPVTPPEGQFTLGKRHDVFGSRREALNTSRHVGGKGACASPSGSAVVVCFKKYFYTVQLTARTELDWKGRRAELTAHAQGSPLPSSGPQRGSAGGQAARSPAHRVRRQSARAHGAVGTAGAAAPGPATRSPLTNASPAVGTENALQQRLSALTLGQPRSPQPRVPLHTPGYSSQVKCLYFIHMWRVFPAT